MQPTLSNEIFISSLKKNEGILAKPLKIIKELITSGDAKPILDAIVVDQKKCSEERHKKLTLKGRVKTTGTGGQRNMKPEVVLAFLISRSIIPNTYGKRGFDILKESSSLKEYLTECNLKSFPSRSCVHEQVISLSKDTHILLNKLILQVVINEGLDPLNSVTFDSTALAADSSWPVDSAIIFKLCSYLFKDFLADVLNLKVSDQRRLPLTKLQKLSNQIGNLNKEINFSVGKKGGEMLRKKLYIELTNKAENFLNSLDSLYSRYEEIVPNYESSPKAFQKYIDLQDKILTTQRRFGINCEPLENDEPRTVLSVADADAVIIEKGDREKTFGYRPSFGLSASGFITSYLILIGNTNDCIAYSKLYEMHKKLTGVKPITISVDDGYSSAENLKFAQEEGVIEASFSGAKGRKILGDEVYKSENYKKLRNDRSAVEGLMSNLKNVRDLKRLTVRSIKRAEIEILIKIIGHNLEKLVTKLVVRAKPQKNAA